MKRSTLDSAQIKEKLLQEYKNIQKKDKLSLVNRKLEGCITEAFNWKCLKVGTMEEELAEMRLLNTCLVGKGNKRCIGQIDEEQLKRYRERRICWLKSPKRSRNIKFG